MTSLHHPTSRRRPALAGTCHYVRQPTARYLVMQYPLPMLHEFLSSHRIELIRRCREKVADRFMPAGMPADAEHGVPLFLQQMIDTLGPGQFDYTSDGHEGMPNAYPAEISRTATLHGMELERRGYTVDQVVHDYGDVCQAVTELAIEQNTSIDSDDFRILNGCLDNAIAGTVTAFAKAQETIYDQKQGRKGASEGRE